ncbi:MAG: hypothetical protein NTW95_12645, partial [Candidatus Aminicenantes bacterium]|nr:hypothetical protein [Candidatus Aminicenantes bacterium]
RYRLESAVGSDGKLRGSVEVTAEGQSDSGLRRAFTRFPVAQWPTELKREFFRMHPGAKITDLVFTDPYDISKPMRVFFRVEIPGYLKKGKSMAYVKPLAASLPFQGVLAFLRLDTSLAERKYPFRLRSSQQVEVSETMGLPSGWRLLQPLSLQKVNGSGADFSGTFKVEGGLVLRAQLLLKKRICQPEDWQSVRGGILEFKKIMETPWFFSRGGAK